MSLTENRLKTELFDFFSKITDISGSRILIGFSGGADSLCLAILLAENKKSLNIEPSLAYLDHGIRDWEERRAEGRFIRSFSSRWGLNLFSEEVPPGELEVSARAEGRSLEEAGRDRRYAFFNRILDDEGFDYIALGHHQDDQMETLVMRFFQGSGISGLGGMKSVRDRVLRPLLRIDKSSLLTFLNEREETWITDPSNFKNNFLRNRVRNILIPEIEKVFPGYKKALTSLGEKMAVTSAFLDGETERCLTWRTEDEVTYSVDSYTFFRTPRTLIINSLFQLYNLTNPRRKRVPFRFLNSLPDFTESYSSNMKKCVLLSGYGITLKINKGRVFWTRDIVFPRKNSYLIMIKSNFSFIVAEWQFYTEVMERKEIPDEGIYIRKDLITPPLLVRSRQPGDEIDLPEGKKSLKKLFNGWQIVEEDRWKIPVLQDRNGIIGVIGAPWGGYNRFSVINEAKKKAETDKCYYISWSLREF